MRDRTWLIIIGIAVIALVILLVTGNITVTAVPETSTAAAEIVGNVAQKSFTAGAEIFENAAQITSAIVA